MSNHQTQASTDKEWQTAYVGLGANLGQAQDTLLAASQQLAAAQGVQNLRLSPLYRTAPVDSSGPDYINAVAVLQTLLDPYDLLDVLQAIEQQHGRMRPYRNAPRTLDLDLLLYGNVSIETPRLTVPHPRMHLRAFVLQPLSDLDPSLRLQGKSLAELLKQCSDQALQALTS